MKPGDIVKIVDSEKLPRIAGRLLDHYPQGATAEIKSIIVGFVEIEVNKNISTISLYEGEIEAIEIVEQE